MGIILTVALVSIVCTTIVGVLAVLLDQEVEHHDGGAGRP